MKISRNIILLGMLVAFAFGAIAQVENGGGVTRRTGKDRKKRGAKTEQQAGVQITERMQDFYDTKEPHDADLAWMRVIYRQLDLSKDENAPLYFPEDVIDGQENLFRLILRLVTEGKVPAYEYLDGREIFTEKYQVNVPEMLDRFGIYYKQEGGRNGGITIEEADVPTSQVLNYYIIEKYEFDKRSNEMKTRVEAICPVLNRYGDFGGENRYPMFWVKFDQLRPYLAQNYVFLTDDNNLPLYSLDDYFNLGFYKGDIYKTQNLRNLSLVQQFPDPDDLKLAQDSIEKRLRAFDANLWVPTREEYLAEQERLDSIAEAQELLAAQGDSTIVEARDENTNARSSVRSRKASTTKKASAKKKSNKKPARSKVSNSSDPNAPNSSAEKSVRRRKR